MMYNNEMTARRYTSQGVPRRRYKYNEVGVPFRTRLFATFAILVAMACFVVVISIIATKSKHRKVMRKAHANSYGEIRKAVEKEEEMLNVPNHYEFEETSLKETGQINEDKIFVCRNKEVTPSHILLFTTLPQDGDLRALKIAENTIKTWTALKPHVKPVIFIPEAATNNQRLKPVIETACMTGFDVILIEHCVKGLYPIMGNLFARAYHVYKNSTWYGYADFRQLFDSSLRKALHMIEHHPEILQKGNLIVGKSHQFEVGTESLSPDFPDLMDLGTMVQELYYFDATEDAVLSDDMNYIFTTRHGFPWDKIPAIILDSQYADKFLMWYSMKNISIAAVDATDAVFTLRQYYASEKNKTKTYDLKQYNENLLAKYKYPQYYKKGLGTNKCLEYKLTNNEMPYYVLIQRTRKYIRRVTKTKPLSLSYYCRIVNENNVVFIDGHGAASGDVSCNLVQQVMDIKKLDDKNN